MVSLTACLDSLAAPPPPSLNQRRAATLDLVKATVATRADENMVGYGDKAAAVSNKLLLKVNIG
jgi:hypothetical protein